MNKLLDGKKISFELKKQLEKEIIDLKDQLTLVDISVGFDEATKVYVKQKEKMALSLGFNFYNLHFNEINEDELIKEIEKMNKNKKITGIIVQLPLPSYLDKDKIINSIDPLKDVDGLTNYNLIKLVKNEESLVPCTPKGIITLLDYYNIDVINKNIVIIGRSYLVGLPLFHLLLNKNATVTLCHSKTNNLKEYTKKADILIVCVGKKDLITLDMMKKDSIIIDVGINRVDGKLYGDVSNECIKKCSLITPVPGGVGPMTVISLMENILIAYKLQQK